MTTIEHSLGPADLPALVSLYETYDWWADRTEAEFQRALAGTDEIVTLRADDSDELVAAARILTDYTYYAMVFDVIVHTDRQGEDLGRELMAAVVAHPALSEVNPTLLAREGLVDFYQSCGFEETEPVAHPDGEPEQLRFLAYSRGQ